MPARRNQSATTRLLHRLLAGLIVLSLMLAMLTDGGALAMVSQPTGTSVVEPFQVVTPTPTLTPTLTPTRTPSTISANQCAGLGPDNSPDAFEPGDDTFGGATPLELNQPQTHTLCSTTTSRDIDWLRFIGDVNRNYTVKTFDLSSSVDTLLTVQGTDLFLIDDDNNTSESPGASRVTFIPKVSGAVLIQVTQSSKTPFDDADNDQPRVYRIVLTSEVVTPTPTVTVTVTPTLTPTVTTTPSPCRDDFESDNNRQDAKGLFVNKPQNRFLCGDGDVDWAWFDAVANKPYRLVTTDLAQGVDTVMGLYDSDGTLLQFSDDFPGLGLAARIDFTSKTTTRYYVKVQDSTGHGAENFTYVLRLESDGLTNGGPCLDTHETDGTPETAREILLGQTQNHTFCPEGDADWVRFFALVNKSYTLATSELTVGTDTNITIFASDGTTVIAFDDDGGTSLASRVDFVVPASGVYFGQIKNAGDIGGKGQRYTVTLTAGGAPVLTTPTPRVTRTVTTTPTSGTVTVSPTPATATTTTTSANPTPTIGYTPTPRPSASPGSDLDPEARSRSAPLRGQAAATPLPRLEGFADPAFTAAWVRTDEPVRQGLVSRSWYWGAQAGNAYREPYKGAPNGRRLVQYFDKGRMEMTDPNGDRTSPWFITSGLLVRELISGQIQIGAGASDQREPAHLPLVGDQAGAGLTYASLTRVAALDDDRRVPNRVGQPVIETLSASGKIGQRPELGDLTTNAVYIDSTGHNIPSIFWAYMQQRGPIIQDGTLVDGPISDWLITFGLPLTEAYWTRAVVEGVERDVLVQAFERRVLTYTPQNPAQWQVEMGNVGRHYERWRYNR